MTKASSYADQHKSFSGLPVGRIEGIVRIFLILIFSLTAGITSAFDRSAVPLTPIDQGRVKEITGMLEDTPRGFGEPITQRKHWDRLLRSGHYDHFLKSMDSFVFPAFSKADYFSLSDGSAPSSAKGLTMMRNRAGGLSQVTIAECLENKGRYIKSIEDGLKSIIDQKSWVSPRVDYDFINYNGKQYTIDLTSALYAHTIAQTLYLLGDKLNPELRKEAVEALYIRVFRPLRKIFDEQDTQYHSWLTGTNNWNAVCLSGVIGAALTIIPDKQERAVYAYIGEHYSRNTLAGIGDDGYCSEGVTYFNYGFGHYAMLRENLWLATNGKIDLFQIPKVKSIALYIPKLEIINGVFPAISDSKVGSKPDSSLMHYLSKSLGLGLTAFEQAAIEGRTHNNRMDVLMVFPNSATEKPGSTDPKSQNADRLRSYFDVSGILVARPTGSTTGALAAAMKGGHNEEHHNHNDVGSYTVVVGNEILAGDPGSIPYTADIFQKDFRYTYKSVASYGHPVPLVAGRQQEAGAQARATVLSSEFEPKADSFVLDLSSCYDVKTLRKLERGFTYHRDKKGLLEVTDSFEFTQPEEFETAWITRASVSETAKGEWLFDLKGEKVRVKLDTFGLPYKIAVEQIEEGGVPYARFSVKTEKPVKSGKIKLTYQLP